MKKVEKCRLFKIKVYHRKSIELKAFVIKSFRLTRIFSIFQFNGDEYKTQFTDLDFDCLFLIFEHLKFIELLNLAKTSDLLSTVAATAFRSKYSRFQIVVRDEFDFPKKKSSELLNVANETIGRVFQRFGIIRKEEKKSNHIEISGNDLIIDDYDTILNVFTHFGCVIKRLKFMTSVAFKYSKEEFLGNLFSEYISDSLITIDFEKSNDRLLKHFTKPLVNVKTVRFRETFFHRAPESLPLNELFPAIQGLAMVQLGGKWQNYFNCHMPNLKEMFIKGIQQSFIYTATDSLTNVIRQNPQIRDIRLYDVDSDFVHNVNSFLPNLKTLKLTKFELQNGNIQFDNVTELRVGFYSSTANLHFPNLKFIDIQYHPKRFVEWLEFLREHTKLRRLSLELYEMNDSQFQQFTANLNDVVEMTIIQVKHDVLHQFEGLSTNAIVEFLRTHEKVRHLKIQNNCSKQYKAELERLKHEWHIKITDRSLSFVRKTKS